ncbi:hypothetical protein, partial [Mycolicibacter sinensis]|uniref:hypothetical protein n=1 Tax=Mycolicibacter sinensis (strain JDM601) TaxID=875328 RepID=UPI001F460A56
MPRPTARRDRQSVFPVLNDRLRRPPWFHPKLGRWGHQAPTAMSAPQAHHQPLRALPGLRRLPGADPPRSRATDPRV